MTWFIRPTSRSRLELEVMSDAGVMATVYAAPDFDHESAARLIAATPDLLDACEAFVALDHSKGLVSSAILERFRAAITRADGGWAPSAAEGAGE